MGPRLWSSTSMRIRCAVVCSRHTIRSLAECVTALVTSSEVIKKLADGRVAVRQSTDPDGPALVFTPREMTSFLTGVKAGDADFLL
ncbi:DUF397 domain-containing protein [Streptomyces sp. NPDC001435]|uniref:DUF397 domain-containing protein n=1 Tax=unclassified Streptomyces TaxID=2593676 RepID=UPI00369FD320